MSGAVKVNETLTVGWVSGKRPHVYVERSDAGLVRIELDEVRGLVAALTDAAVYVVSDAAGGDTKGGDIVDTKRIF